MFYNSFENQGYGPTLSENYPFVFNFNYGVTADPSDPHAGIVDQVAPVRFNTAFTGCSARPGGTAMPSSLDSLASSSTQRWSMPEHRPSGFAI